MSYTVLREFNKVGKLDEYDQHHYKTMVVVDDHEITVILNKHLTEVIESKALAEKTLMLRLLKKSDK
jgi:hypothetical protein